MPRPHPPAPVLLSPATPQELLRHIIAHHHRHPTTLILANYSSRADFVACLVKELQPHDSCASEAAPSKRPLLANTIHQAAAARHIRVLTTPTITHLRALLSTFPTPKGEHSAVPPPPSTYTWATPPDKSCSECKIPTAEPLLVVYGLVDAHRGTSEWSGQGVGATAAAVVDACAELGGFRAVLVEPKQRRRRRRVSAVYTNQDDNVDGNREHHGKTEDEDAKDNRLDSDADDTELDDVPISANWLDEEIPLLSGFHDDESDEKMVAIGSVLGRWFRLVRPPPAPPLLETTHPPAQTATRPISPRA